MKKTCNSCKAYNNDGECMLGHKNIKGKPLKECPKPLSWKQFERIRKSQK